MLASDHAHGDGPFTASATRKLNALTGGGDALLTSSCTHALEMAFRLLEIGEGDEVILPTFTFPSVGDAVAATGASAVFVDIDPATGNADADQIAEAVGPRTRAISIVHYGGMPADLDRIMAIADEHGLPVVEDNAHGLGVFVNGAALGRVGTFGTQSFHDTKNVHAGEGGALLINDPRYQHAAEIMREKGTNRTQFLRGLTDKYTWVSWGSSYLPSELTAAVLDAQLDAFVEIQDRRHSVWSSYRSRLQDWANSEAVTLMTPPGGIHAAHLFYVLAASGEDRDDLLQYTRARGVQTTFHYIPLDSSPAGRRFGRVTRPLDRAADFSARLVRLPLWPSMTSGHVDRVIETVTSWHSPTRGR